LLPGSDPFFGQSLANAVSTNGKIVAGLNTLFFGPGGSLGFVWTPRDKLQTANDYFAKFGYHSEPGFVVTNVFAMTPDGKHFAVTEGTDSPPFKQHSLVISIQ
jgi:hypothetical protein